MTALDNGTEFHGYKALEERSLEKEINCVFKAALQTPAAALKSGYGVKKANIPFEPKSDFNGRRPPRERLSGKPSKSHLDIC
jgi:hypothetical protein